MCSSSGRPFVHAVLYGKFFILLCKKIGRWKNVFDTSHLLDCWLPYKTACTNGLPDDEDTMCFVLCIVFVDCVVLCIVCLCVLYYCHRVSTQLKLNISYHIISWCSKHAEDAKEFN